MGGSAGTDAMTKAEMVKSLQTQNPGIAIVLTTLQKMDEMQQMIMQSMGVGQNVDLLA